MDEKWLERFITIQLFYDWLGDYPLGLSALSFLTDEELLSFISYIIERYEEE